MVYIPEISVTHRVVVVAQPLEAQLQQTFSAIACLANTRDRSVPRGQLSFQASKHLVGRISSLQTNKFRASASQKKKASKFQHPKMSSYIGMNLGSEVMTITPSGRFVVKPLIAAEVKMDPRTHKVSVYYEPCAYGPLTAKPESETPVDIPPASSKFSTKRVACKIGG